MPDDRKAPRRLETIQKQIDRWRAQAEKAINPDSKKAWLRMADEWENLRKGQIAVRKLN